MCCIWSFSAYIFRVSDAKLGVMKNQLRLHYAPDNASVIIRVALLEIGVPFETVLVNRSIRQQDSEDYRALNPSGLIPVLETDQGALFETGAILLWLVDRFGKFGPSVDNPQRGEFLKWLFFLSNTVHSEMRQHFYASVYVGENQNAIDALQKQRGLSIPEHLGKLETLINGKPFLLGDELSVLDIYLSFMMRWMGLYPPGKTNWYEISATPQLANLAQRLETRESYRVVAKAEGLGDTPLSNPNYPNPPEGSAT